jgi:hypothetical protein
LAENIQKIGQRIEPVWRSGGHALEAQAAANPLPGAAQL